jgi:hypothetical protein
MYRQGRLGRFAEASTRPENPAETRIHQCKAVTGSNEEPTNSALDQSDRAKHSVLLLPSIRPLVGQGLCRLQPADDGPVEHRQDFDIADLHLQVLHFSASMPS